MTKEDMLKQITDEELRKEVARRIVVRKALRAEANKNKAQCRNCKHFGTITKFGTPKGRAIKERYKDNYYCPYALLKIGRGSYGKYRSLRGYEYACEQFEKHEENLNDNP